MIREPLLTILMENSCTRLSGGLVPFILRSQMRYHSRLYLHTGLWAERTVKHGLFSLAASRLLPIKQIFLFLSNNLTKKVVSTGTFDFIFFHCLSSMQALTPEDIAATVHAQTSWPHIFQRRGLRWIFPICVWTWPLNSKPFLRFLSLVLFASP